ncbi:YifB family Mg chelatase-like AAA ATPase [Gayadomonas joobiniege]|uniref:YifB family Mg chelatase-like AAA ATPase n=1 Tax=Gayadomonas joobiniege TaxID=1234606 RepID=UPI000371C6AB|nr:YifB family Mg chelatase-like AAA ATPase [Gayadomonas joobiniege]
MPLALVYSRARVAIEAPLVTIEVHISNGLPAFTIVGLPETSVREARDRVRSAIINSGFEFPDRRITVNLAPADLPKEGGRYDLAIAVGILGASEQLDSSQIVKYELMGELALSGELRPIVGEIPAAIAAREHHKAIILPPSNALSAACIKHVEVYSAESLLQVCQHLAQSPALQALPHQDPEQEQGLSSSLDFMDVIGQQHAKKALEIAAAGQHHILMMGPPGTGKTMLAERLAGILPPLSEEEALSCASIHSVCGATLNPTNWRQRPFRSPHHTCSAVALVGGSSNPRPGEISLAHNGVLFLDELPEFNRKSLEVLREPLQNARITISRAARQVEFPAKFQLVAALNPSPCGHYNDEKMRSTPDQILRYLNKLSGPLLDRIDIQIEVPKLAKGSLQNDKLRGESSAVIRKRVLAAHQLQLTRQGKLNAQLNNRELSTHAKLAPSDADFVERAIEKLALSVRAYHRIIKVARTIADLEGQKDVKKSHLAQSLSYRAMDRLLQNLHNL